MELFHSKIWAAIIIILALVAGILWQFNMDSEKSSRENPSPVREALFRIPLPPLPDDMRDEKKINKKQNLTQVTPTVLYKRDLLGMRNVAKAVSYPTSECGGNNRERFKCYADYITLTTQNESIEVGFIKVKELYNKGDQYVIAQCHQLVHVIGRAAAVKFVTVAEAYNYGDTFCWSGYYHGIMEAILTKIGVEELPTRLNQICSVIPGKSTYSFNYFNCVHGIGHGLMYVAGHNLFDALNSCDNLDSSWERESCYGGVYMENVIANDVDHISIYLKDDDLAYPCNVVDEKYKMQCYLMHTSYVLTKENGDFNKVFLFCASVELNYKDICYQSLGRDASGQSTSNAVKTKAICLMSQNKNAQKNCIIGAVKDFISYYHSDTEVLELCDLLSENLKNVCLQTSESYFASF